MSDSEEDVEFSTEATRATLTALAAAVRDSNAIPSGSSRDVVLLTQPKVRAALETTMSLVTDALREATKRVSVAQDEEANVQVTAPSDALERSLELAHSALDRAEGRSIVVKTPPRGYARRIRTKPVREKPQLKFHDYPIDNSSAAFVPPFGPRSAKSGFVKPENGCDKHPYVDEIAAAAEANAVADYDEDDVTVFRSLEETPFGFVNTKKKLFNMAKKLAKCKELAFDIENHQERSYLGFTCLVQVSTRKEDFVIDAMNLRKHMFAALSKVLLDPSIVKVFHAADMDMQWLERDFGLYVVNMFDTGKASRALGYPASLAYLLSRYCDVNSPNKKSFQLADWRVRPLLEEMLHYARCDTHYLLYIYDRLRAECFAAGKLADVWRSSAMIAQRRFSKPAFRHTLFSARGLAAKRGLCFNMKQINAMYHLFVWREDIARNHDESPTFVLPISVMIEIVRESILLNNVAKIAAKVASKFKHRIAVENKLEIAQIIQKGFDAEIEPEVAKLLEEKIADTKKPALLRLRDFPALGSSLSNKKGEPNKAQGTKLGQSSKGALDVVMKTQKNGSSFSLRKSVKHNDVGQLVAAQKSRPKVSIGLKKQSDLFEDSSDGESTSHYVEPAISLKGQTHDGNTSYSKKKSVAGLDSFVKKVSPTKEPHQIVKASKSVFDLSDSDEDNAGALSSGAVTSAPKGKSTTRAPAEKSGAGMFDLSDSESGDDATQSAVAAVLAELEKTSKASLLPFSKIGNNPTALSKIPHCPDESVASVSDPSAIGDREVEEPLPLSKQGAKARVHRRRNKKSKAAAAEPAPVMEPFNYAAAAENERANPESATPFDIYASLKPGASEKQKRPRKSKKNPASGSRSLTFNKAK